MTEELFSRSPFGLTASEEISACWAGRHEVLEQLQRMLSAYERRSDSSLDVMWANLGAGKSHVLFHLAYQLLSSQQNPSKSLPVVVEVPEQIKSFHDFYRQIVQRIPVSELAVALTQLPTTSTFRELKQAGQVLLHGGELEKGVAWDWLTGGRPHIAELKRCTNIGHRIEDDIAATDALCGILASLRTRRIRLVVLVDEFQRVGVLKKAARESMLSCLRSVFSRTPELFSMVLGAALRMERNALELLSPELRTLLGRRPTIALPEMSEGEALEFVAGRFQFFRPSGYVGSQFAPFSEEAALTVMEILKEKGRPLIPREILQSLTYCFDEASHSTTEIGATECRKILEKLVWDES